MTATPPDIDLFYQRVMVSARSINPVLKSSYIRKTGVMETLPVIRNYVRFANWIRLVDIEGHFVNANAYTRHLSNLQTRNDFALSPAEKMGFFLRIIEKVEVKSLLAKLGPMNKIANFLDAMSEHYVETFFEWFVDLGILKPTAKTGGAFVVSSDMWETVKSAGRDVKDAEMGAHFAEGVLGSPISSSEKLPRTTLLRLLNESIGRSGQMTVSEVDPRLHSALPHILDVQLNSILENRRFYRIDFLVSRLKALSADGAILFNWDPLTSAGYLKMREGRKVV
jgi:hypothetical protein